MTTEDRKQITISVDAETNERLEAEAAKDGVSVTELCQNIVEVELYYAEVGERRRRGKPISKEAIDGMYALRKAYFGGKKIPGDSADDIRAMREERALQIERAVEGR